MGTIFALNILNMAVEIAICVDRVVGAVRAVGLVLRIPGWLLPFRDGLMNMCGNHCGH
ncbi:MAG: hypothetical protein KKA54_04085 [Proteobacteria bacterium]|nr:hypothetical protein [Pseudomonadota bacterium]